MVPSACVRRHGGHQGGVDASRKAEDHAREAVLSHIVLESENAGGVDLLVRIELGGQCRDPGGGSGLRQRPIAQILHESRRAFQQRAVAVDDETPPVEYEIVLSSDRIEINQRRADLRGAPRSEVDARAALAFLV